VGAFVFENRLQLLFPKWLAGFRATTPEATLQGMANYALKRLDASLDRPEGAAFEEWIPADPLLLLPDAVGTLERMPEPEDLPDGLRLLEVKLSVSALSREGQEPVFEVFEAAVADARRHSPNFEAVD